MLAAAEASAKPVVVIFLGADPASITRNGVHGAAYLAQAADMAVALAKGGTAADGPIAVSNEMRRTLSDMAHGDGAEPALRPRHLLRRHLLLRGAAHPRRGGDQGVLQHADRGQLAAAEIDGKSRENTIIDMGDDQFTQGRPHPMIDPSLRDARIRDGVADPTTAVVLFDVVLGYGSAEDPTAGLPGVDRPSQGQRPARRAARSRSSATFAEPIRTRRTRSKVVAGLKSAGVLVASSNAEAATWSARLISERQGANA